MSVSKSYGMGAARRRPLEGVNLALPRGETTSLVGRSGSGKSTLLGVIAGLLQPDSGHVRIDGRATEVLPDADRAQLRADRIGVVLQSGNLIPFLSAQENVELAVGLGRRRRTHRARELLAELGLAQRRHHRPRQLSGGEAQRVALAVALANDPDLLLADEVVGQLDSATAGQVMDLVFRTARERKLTVLYVTHDEQLAQAADHPVRLENRRVVAC